MEMNSSKPGQNEYIEIKKSVEIQANANLFTNLKNKAPTHEIKNTKENTNKQSSEYLIENKINIIDKMIHKPSKSTIEKCFKQTETVTREEKSIEELINQKLYDDDNDGLERKYKRKEGYRLNLFVLTNQTIKYSDNLQELTNEIKDTMDIDSIIEAKVLFNSPGQIDIKLRTNNLDDFIKMRESSNWPLQIFGSETGVNVKVVPIELKLSISGVEKETIFDSKQLEKLMKKQQISNFERQCYNVGDIMVATNKVNFTADNLKANVDAQKTCITVV